MNLAYSKISLIFIFTGVLLLFLLPRGTQAGKMSKAGYLPLVLLKDKNSGYKFPRCYRKDSQGTIRDFTATNDKAKQTYFCPNDADGSNSRFLYLTNGIEYRCNIAPDPTIRKVEIKQDNSHICSGTGDLYSYGYNISEKPFDKQDSSENWIEIYSFCFVPQNHQVVYLKYRLLSPNLLANRDLTEERFYYEGKYRLEEFEDVALKGYIKALIDFNSEQQDPLYTKMLLAPPADMVFPNWKKPFFHAVNQGIMLRKVKKQWKRISSYLRKLAQKTLGEIEIITGTLPYPDTATGPLPHPPPKLYGYWWKIVAYKNQAIAIILHNAYVEPPQNHANTEPESKTQDQPANTRSTSTVKDVDPSNDVVANQPATSSRPSLADYPMHEGYLCKVEDDICKANGFHGLATKDVVHAYCCDPRVITERLKLPEYDKILDLKAFKGANRPTAGADGCPKDPLQGSNSGGKTPPEDSEKIKKE